MELKEVFKKGDEQFTIEIKEYPHKKFNFDGIYVYRVRNQKGEEVAYLSPGKVVFDGRELPHRVAYVKKEYRNKGIFTFILKKAKEMNDEMVYQLVKNPETKKIYEKLGYELIETIRQKVSGIDYHLLKLKK